MHKRTLLIYTKINVFAIHCIKAYIFIGQQPSRPFREGPTDNLVVISKDHCPKETDERTIFANYTQLHLITAVQIIQWHILIIVGFNCTFDLSFTIS